MYAFENETEGGLRNADAELAGAASIAALQAEIAALRHEIRALASHDRRE